MNEPMPETPQVPGYEAVVAWFGAWPSFHDAEILELQLCQAGESRLRVYCWLITDEADPEGRLVTTKHATVTFRLAGIRELELDGFSNLNVIFGLSLGRVDDGFRIDLSPCFGLSGFIVASEVRIEIEPGFLTEPGRGPGPGPARNCR